MLVLAPGEEVEPCVILILGTKWAFRGFVQAFENGFFRSIAHVLSVVEFEELGELDVFEPMSCTKRI